MNKSKYKFVKKFIATSHGKINLPAFAPDATRGFIKSVPGRDLEKAGIRAMVVNTYHLMLSPGMEIIKKAGGIHKFMDWKGPLISDSGGYQVFSLIHRSPEMGKINDDGVIFRSPIDGSKYELTPEKSIQIQFDLGVDMMVCLDDCPPNDYDRDQIEMAVNRTIMWAARCRDEYDRQIKRRRLSNSQRPLLLGVIQGGIHLDLRKFCADELIKIDFDGYGFGARHIDEQGKRMDDVLEYTASLIPDDRIKFALGVGTPEDIAKCVSYGWEIFDCVMPTREGRHGKIFSWKSKNFKKTPSYKDFNITNAKYARDFSTINAESKLPELRSYTKAYLHHLFKMKEPLASRLASLNNLEFYLDLIKKLK